ncbi:MAG: hypothetical protein ACLUDH_10690 [Faecalispora sporosphaeroides]|uniref:AbiJ-related protein n=1 Tax=Faecalispora sporosphaeroides TaxID=1549 RepID=UPI0039954A4C
MSDMDSLRQIIVDELKETKAYNLEVVLEKYELIPNRKLDPMHSKRVYVDSALCRLSLDKLKLLANRIIKEESNPEFAKKCEPFLDDDFFEISTITRRKIVNWLCGQLNVEGKLRIDEMLSSAWDLESLPSRYDRSNALEDIMQHMVRNDDLSYKELFEDVLQVMYVSDAKFISLINAMLHPRVRNTDDQLDYVKNINAFLIADGYSCINTKHISGEPVYAIIHTEQGVSPKAKNIVFASIGKKPDIVIDDSLSNDIKVIDPDNKCLVYNIPLSSNGISWDDLVTWWNKGSSEYNLDVEKALFERLKLSLDSPPEIMFLRTYNNYIHKLGDNKLPALIPQVYCHYDPKTANMRNGQIYVHQRMDFLMLLPSHKRIVFEIDGAQHYSVDGKASPELYSKMVNDDRKLKLYGYDVYRFGGYEFKEELKCRETIEDFFSKFFKFYNIM